VSDTSGTLEELASPALGGHVRRALVLALNEDVSGLVAALTTESFPVEVVRGPSPGEQLHWSRAVKCLCNHREAWRRVADSQGFTLICEADFVPVRGLASLPLPCPPPVPGEEARIGWLYSPGSTLYGLDRWGYTYGHANSAVAYVLTPECARRCLDFFDEEIDALASEAYTMWDSRLGAHLRWKHGICNYFVVCQYGEHGGSPNPEHERHGFRGWHQAYRLAGRPRFLPPYARGSRLRYLAFRQRAWARGVLRILMLRFFNPRFVDDKSQRPALFRTAAGALLAPRRAQATRFRRSADAIGVSD